MQTLLRTASLRPRTMEKGVGESLAESEGELELASVKSIGDAGSTRVNADASTSK